MSRRPFLLTILVTLFLLPWAAMPAPHSGRPEVSANAPARAIARSQMGDLPTTVTDAGGRFVFPSVPLATHLVYLIESTLPAKWQADLPQTPVRLTLNPGRATSGRITPWVVLEARYEDDTIAGVVFADLDQDGQMGAGDLGLAGVTVIDPGIHQFFVPFYDRDLWQLYSEVNRCQRPNYGDVSDTLESIISLTASEDDTRWFYDHWEDGYDPDPLTPGPTTETGVLSAGQTRVFPWTVDTTDLGNPSNLQYDGKDRVTLFGHPGPMTRIVYPSVVENNDPGVVLATAWEVPEVHNWGDRFVATMGEDLDFNGQFVDDFDYAGLEVMAVEPGTEVYYNGALVATLGPGGTYPVYGAHDGGGGGGVDSDDVITASAPIQVETFVGGCDMAQYGWSAQGYTLEPVAHWGNEYWAPVPDFTDGVGGCDIDLEGNPNDDRDIDIYIHNPGDSAIIVTVNIPGSLANPSTQITIPPHTTQSVMRAPETQWDDLPPDADNVQAIQLISDDSFWAVAMIDSSSDGTNEPRINDWGYSLVPRTELSSQVAVGWAPGDNDSPMPSSNGNLAFVTAVLDTRVFVDLDQDGVADNFDMNGDGDAADVNVFNIAAFDETTSAAGVDLVAGQVLRVGDPNDHDLRGALIYTPNLAEKIAAAWGQDACATDCCDPYLDLGYTPLAVEIPRLDKVSDLAIDADGSGDISAGDTLVYTVTIDNNGFGAMSNVVLTDTLPYAYTDFLLDSIVSTQPYQSETYDSGNGLFNYDPPGTPGVPDPNIQAFRLTWTTINGREAVTTTFRVAIQADIPVGVSEICNFAAAHSDESGPVEADTCRLVTQQEPTPTNTPTSTPTATPTTTGTPPTPTATPTGTRPTPTHTPTGTRPTPTPTTTVPPRKPPPAEIPEPLTLVLMGGGLAAVAAYARLRRR